jgi:hypothetical protein
MPPQDRVGRHDGRDRRQDLAAQRLALGSQPTTLVIRQEQPFPAGLELLFENAILFDQVRDCTGLLTADPAGRLDDEKSELGEVSHRASLAGVPASRCLAHRSNLQTLRELI